MDTLAACLLDFFSKLSGKHFIDHTFQMYRLIRPHCLCILPWFSNSGDTMISVYIYVTFCHAKHLRTSSVISDQASMYMCSLVGVFCSRHFSVKQLTFEIYIILCQYCHHSFILVLKIKINLVKLTCLAAISSHQVMGMSLTKVWVMENIPR